MNHLLKITLLLFICVNLNAQEEKVEINPNLNNQDYDKFNLLEGRKGCGCLVQNPNRVNQKTGFKIHTVTNNNWILHQDMYNAITASVPGVQISKGSLNQSPIVKTRGDENTIVIVDGIRYDASILNAINPADIESVQISTSIAAQNYFWTNWN